VGYIGSRVSKMK